MGRKRWSVEEKRRIVELTLVPGASVARVAQAEGVNANQVFLWRRAYRNGELQTRKDGSRVVTAHQQQNYARGLHASSHLEQAGRAEQSCQDDGSQSGWNAG